MSEPIIVHEERLRKAVPFDDQAMAAVSESFRIFSDPDISVQLPPILQIEIPERNGLTCVKGSYREGDDTFAVKLASTYSKNREDNIPSASGIVLVCSAVTGQVKAILLDNGYLTALRTQAAGASALDAASRPDAHVLTMVGSGHQAALQMLAACHVRDIHKAFVWSNDPAHAASFADAMSRASGVETLAVADPAEAARASDIVITATSSHDPILDRDWLAQGQTILAMGADAPGKSEISVDVFPHLDRYICDSEEQCRRCSDLGAAVRAGVLDPGFEVFELGEVLSHRTAGRTSPQAIVMVDLTGLGVQDTAIAQLAVAKCVGSLR